MPYPDELDGLSEIHNRYFNGVEWVTGTKWEASVVNPWLDAINNVETELGLNPAGTYTTVADRLAHAETDGGGLADIRTDTHFVTGIANRALSTISFTSATRIFTIAPTGTAFYIYADGVKIPKASSSVEISNTVGLHFIYFTSAGVLTASTTPWTIISSNVPVAIVYWNGTAGVLSDERHSAGRNQQWHQWAHECIGTQYDYGLAGTFSSSATAITEGEIHDEDLNLIISPQTSVRLWYRNGSTMTFDVTGSAITAKVVSSALKFDSSGTLTSVSSSKFITNWLYASLETTLPIYCVVGQAEYNTVALARLAPLPTFPNMPTAELKLLYRVIWQNSGGTATYVESADYRKSTSLPAGGTSVVAASNVTVNPAGTIAATTVQAALEELDAEKSAASHTHVGADVTTAVASATNADTLDTLHATSFLQVAPNQTISIPSGSTAAQINALIAAVPKYIPYGSTVVFQFADGTYTLNATLSFSGFLGGGSIVLYGNLGEANATVAHTTQAVHLDFSATNCEGLFFYGNKCNVGIYNLRISAISNTSSRRCVYFQQCHTVGLCYSYLLGTNNTGTNTGACVLVTDCAGGIIVSCYFSFHVYGIYANRTALSSATNSSVAGSEPCYGLYVSAAQLRKTSTQPAGSVAAEATTSGGQIIGTETWWTSANDGSGTGLDADTVDGVHASSMVQNATTRTVNFTSTMTAAEINALIAAVPKYVPYGQTLTFQFGDGTYTLTAPLYFNGFNGAGSVYIYGNTTEAGATTLHTTQQVILDFSATSCHGVYLSNTRCYTIIRNLKIITKSEVATQYGLYIELCPYVLVYYNYVLGTGYAAGYAGCCITVTAGAYARILYNYVSANTYGITVSNANAQSDRNESTGASLLYGLYAYGSLILKYGTQPAGSTANELIARGGQIISSDKYWTDANDGTGSGLDADTVDGVHASTILQIGGSVTVNLASTMTTAEIQAAIDAVPRFVNYGATVVFQFAAGTYTLTAQLSFIGFLGGGTVTIQGNRSEANASALHTTQDVHLNFSGTSCHGVYIQECKCTVNVYNLKISNVSNASSYRALQVRKSTYVSFAYNYLLGTSAAAGASSAGILVTEGSKAALTANYLGLNTYGVIAGNTSEIYSSGNDDVAGSLPVYGLYAGSSTIYKVGTQPDGTTANELTADGGQIRGAEKYWTDANDGTGSGLDADSVDGTHLSGLCAWKGALASAPGTPAEGWIYYNTGDSKTYIYANAGWKALT